MHMTYLWIYRPYVFFPTDIARGAIVFKTQIQKRQHHAHMMTQHREDSREETAASTEQTAHRRHGREGEGSEWWGSHGPPPLFHSSSTQT